MNLKEFWKDIIWYEWKYKISNIWNIWSYYKSWTQRLWDNFILLDWTIDRKWYLRIKIKWKVQKIHRLVAIHFIPNPNNLPQVNHIDWDKLNNNANNLEWCTSKENTIHAWKIWLCKVSDNNNFKTNKTRIKYWEWKRGYLNPNSKVVNKYSLDMKFIKEYWSASEAARELKCSSSCVIDVCNKKRNSTKWFIFKYK